MGIYIYKLANPSETRPFWEISNVVIMTKVCPFITKKGPEVNFLSTISQ